MSCPLAQWNTVGIALLADVADRLPSGGVRPKSAASELSTDQWTILALFFGVALAMVGILWLGSAWLRFRRRRTYRSPRRLFHELSAAHGLSYAERQLLRDMAAWSGLPNGMLLFVEPERFYSTELREALGRPLEISQLADKLFGPLPEVGEAPPAPPR